MSGIAGIFHLATPKPVDPARVRRMIDVQAHRGPDGGEVWTAPGVGLGDRGSSVIDPQGQGQRMIVDGLAITHDGAIHNAAALRAEFQARGVRFGTRGDAEVLLYGWRAWGPAMLDRLDGTFAMAIHDAAAATLFLARDRLGVKPLHYVELPDGAIAFASELKGLLAHPLLRRVPDLTAVEDYLAYGYVPDDACLVAGVRKLAAGHYLLVERGRTVPRPRQWWSVDFSAPARGSADMLGEELVERMRTAVRSSMIADVPVGALLSGGIDSSTVVALMAEASPRAVLTCATGTDDVDLAPARAIAARFATSHGECVVDSDDLSLADKLAHHLDEPSADASVFAIFRLYAFARERVTVALAGDGIDQVVAGHRRYRDHVGGERVRSFLPERLRTRLFGALGAHLPLDALGLKSTLEALGGSGAEAYARSIGIITPAQRRALFSHNTRRALGGYRAEERVIAAMVAAPVCDPLDVAQYVDLKIGLPGRTLTKLDRIGMAVGLEVRTPLLDHHLIEFAATLPASMRLRHGQGKWLMRRSLRRYLPDEILHRPDKSPAKPLGAWFRGPLAGEAAALARSGMLAESGWFDVTVLARLADDHRTGRADHGRMLWQLLMLEKSSARLFG